MRMTILSQEQTAAPEYSHSAKTKQLLMRLIVNV